MTRFHFCLIALLSIVLAPNLSAAVCASSSTCTFTFNIDNGGTTGNFGTVNLQTQGSNILVTISLISGLHIIQTGSHQAFDFNGTTGVTDINFSNNQYSEDLSGAPFHDAAFGNFSNAVDTTAGPGAGTTGVTTLSFDVQGHTNVNDIVGLSTSSPGAYFAADVFADASVCSSKFPDFGGSCTGLIAVTGAPNPVPEPSSYLCLLAAGFGVIAFLVERSRRLSA